MTAKTGKAEQEKQTGQSVQKNSQAGIARAGLFGVECHDMSVRQDSLEKTARLG
jgi:hypothetical protein